MAGDYPVEQWRDSSGRLLARYVPLGIEVSADTAEELEQDVIGAIGRAARSRTGFTIRWIFVQNPS